MMRGRGKAMSSWGRGVSRSSYLCFTIYDSVVSIKYVYNYIYNYI